MNDNNVSERLGEHRQGRSGSAELFYRVPNDLLERYGSLIGPYGIAVYNVLALHRGHNDECWPSLPRIGRLTKCSPRKVWDALRELAKLELIRIIHPRPGRKSNTYQLVLLPAKKPPQKAKRGNRGLPQDFAPTEAHRTLAAELGLDLVTQFAKFSDHHRAKGSSLEDWGAAFSGWLRRAHDFAVQDGKVKPAAKVDSRFYFDGRPGWTH